VIATSARVAQRAVLPAIAASPSACLVAVASPCGEPGRDYATFGAPRVHRSYAPPAVSTLPVLPTLEIAARAEPSGESA
jgi:hypothetical protein